MRRPVKKTEKMVDLVCAWCGKEFYRYKHAVRKTSFCSKSCQNQGHRGNGNPTWKGGKVELVCQECGKVFMRYLSMTKEKVFCSIRCRNRNLTSHQDGDKNPYWKGGKKTLSCEICGKEFVSYTSDRTGRFCSLECAYKSPDRLENLSRNSKRVWTNPEFRNAHLGANNPAWKGGNTAKIRKHRATYKAKVWRETVYERDGYACQLCHKSGAGIKLHAHHLLSFTNCPDYRYEISNGVTLCKECHLDIHFSKKRKYLGGASEFRQKGLRGGDESLLPLYFKIHHPTEVVAAPEEIPMCG